MTVVVSSTRLWLGPSHVRARAAHEGKPKVVDGASYAWEKAGVAVVAMVGLVGIAGAGGAAKTLGGHLGWHLADLHQAQNQCVPHCDGAVQGRALTC